MRSGMTKNSALSTFFPAATGEGVEVRERACRRSYRDKVVQRWADVGEEMGFFALEAKEAVGAEGLHQALCGGEQEKFTEGIPIVRGAGNLVIIEKEILTPCFWKGDVGIAEKRGEVVEKASGAYPLEIDQDRFAVTDHHVL